MKINQKQITAVLSLNAEDRYAHFVKVIADWQEVWGLYSEGWALVKDDDDKTAFPMWPAKEYAELCAEKEWLGYVPKSFSIDELLNFLLPKLKQDDMLPGIFFTPSGKGMTPSIEQLVSDLDVELKKY